MKRNPPRDNSLALPGLPGEQGEDSSAVMIFSVQQRRIGLKRPLTAAALVISSAHGERFETPVVQASGHKVVFVLVPEAWEILDPRGEQPRFPEKAG
jgi:hypothetical protein